MGWEFSSLPDFIIASTLARRKCEFVCAVEVSGSRMLFSRNPYGPSLFNLEMGNEYVMRAVFLLGLLATMQFI